MGTPRIKYYYNKSGCKTPTSFTTDTSKLLSIGVQYVPASSKDRSVNYKLLGLPRFATIGAILFGKPITDT